MSYDDTLLDDTDDDRSPAHDTYLTFNVGSEQYSVAVTCVTEIVRLQESYAIPDVPLYVRGVINLRGKVIPLIDVRSRFGMAQSPYTDRTVIVVIEHADTATGLVVDGVSDVSEIPPDQIEPRPAITRSGERSSLLSGVGKRASGVSFIIDVQAMLETMQEQQGRFHTNSPDQRRAS